MAQRWFAFLRAMNTGGRRLTNDELCAAVSACGIEGPQAYQASGNVVFDDDRGADELQEALESGLRRELGYEVPTFLRSGEEVGAIASAEPFTDEQLAATEGRRQVIFLYRELDPEVLEEVTALIPREDVVVPGSRELHWLPVSGVGDSELDFGQLERVTGGTTLRTYRTVQRLAARFL